MYYNKKFLKKLLKALKVAATGARPHKLDGICVNVTHRMSLGDSHRSKRLLKQLFTLWPKFSGSPTFPLPGMHYSFPYWDRSTQQGRDRHELLAFITEEVEHMLDFIEESEKQEDEDD